MPGFASDNTSGVHPRVLEAIAAVNEDHVPGYGDDPHSARAVERLREAFDADAEILFCFGGTGANVVALASLVRQHEAVICADTAHIWNDECGAPERFLGSKLIALPSADGKLRPADLETALHPRRGVHRAVPRVLSITQPTEWGTLYTADEIRVLADLAHRHGLALHVDGARYANAVAALDCSLADLSHRVGVDVLSFGGTKNGLLGAEAVLWFDRAHSDTAAYARKQAMQLASKMRFLAAQFEAYVEDDLWRRLAGHANAMASRLAAQVADVPGLEFVQPPSCNLLFPRLNDQVLETLQSEFYFYTWNERAAIARWITSFDTTEADVDRFAAAVGEAMTAA